MRLSKVTFLMQYVFPRTQEHILQIFEMKNDFSRSAPVLKITPSSTRRYTPHIPSSCQGGASGNSTIGEWTMKPVSQLSAWELEQGPARSERGEITATPSTGSRLRAHRGAVCRQWREPLCAQQGLLLGHQRTPAVRDDRHGLRDDSKLPLPCQQVSPKAPFILQSTQNFQLCFR